VDGPCRGRPAALRPTGWCAKLRQRRQRKRPDGVQGDLAHALDPGPKGQEHGELIAAIGGVPGGADRRIQDTDPLQWRILRQPSAARTVTCWVHGGDPKGRRIYGFTAARDLGNLTRPCATPPRARLALRQNFSLTQRFAWRASTGADGARLVRSAPARCGGGWPKRTAGPPADPAPRQTPPCNCSGWGRDRAASWRRGLPEQIGRLFLNYWKRGHQRVREGDQVGARPAARRTSGPACEPPHPAELLRQALEATGHRRPAGEARPICSRAKGAAGAANVA